MRPSVRRLQAVVGNKRNQRSEFHLTASEVVDITAHTARSAPATVEFGARTPDPAEQTGDDTDALRRVQLRECGTGDVRCVEHIEQEAARHGVRLRKPGDAESLRTEKPRGRAFELRWPEDRGRRRAVAMVVSDRPGGRPDVGELPKVLGQEAAQANIAIYALHLDTSFLDELSAQTAKVDVIPNGRNRDTGIYDRLMVDFSAASGGAFMPVTVGAGEYAFGRVLRETSAHYLLAVEPAESDRDGKLRQLRVKVKESGATIRSRSWVVIPGRGR